ncbi:WD repeat-containing protein DWA2 [Cucurbita argyrosperma subsp. argyrosperma]|nr:WD repeat-containing protein DWA2 [Cucurbita argyrosperma subsp. argyrosperma]
MQGGSSGIGYGLKYQARCIADVKADTDHTSFITGTLSLKDENEVHLIRLSSSGSELICEGLFSHPNEIWDLASCPFDQRIFSTVFSTGRDNEKEEALDVEDLETWLEVSGKGKDEESGKCKDEDSERTKGNHLKG